MKRLWLLVFLVGCASVEVPGVIWVSPSASATVSGTVELVAEPLFDPAPPNAVFYLQDEVIGKATLESGAYRVMWDASAVEEGPQILSVKPYGASEVTLPIFISRASVRPPPSDTPKPENERIGTPEDPFSLSGWAPVAHQIRSLMTLGFPQMPDLNDLYPKGQLVLRTLQAETTPLPRGVYLYDLELDAWVYTPDPNAPGFEVIAPYENQAGEQFVTLSFFWDEVTSATWGASVFEIPTLASLVVTDSAAADVTPAQAPPGEEPEPGVLGSFTYEASYYTPPNCPVSPEPASLLLTGSWYGFAPPFISPDDDGDAPEQEPAQFEQLDVTLDYTFSEPLAELLFDASLLTSNGSSYRMDLSAAPTGELEREMCDVSGGIPDSLTWSSYFEHYVPNLFGEERRTDALLLDLELNNIDLETRRAGLSALLTQIERSSLFFTTEDTMFEGEFHDDNADGYPGEDVVVTLPPQWLRDPNTTLDIYTEDLVNVYRELYLASLPE